MNILIIDDDKSKITKIKDVLLSCKGNEILINEKYSYQSGLKEIYKNEYDVILLDMSMPTFDITIHDDGGKTKELAGKDIMRCMKRKNIITSVIIITQYNTIGSEGIKLSDVILELREKYSDFYIGTIFYDVTIENWKSALMELLNGI